MKLTGTQRAILEGLRDHGEPSRHFKSQTPLYNRAFWQLEATGLIKDKKLTVKGLKALDTMKDALDLIEDEREKQHGRGYTAAHDDRHTEAQLLEAAGSYVQAARMIDVAMEPSDVRRRLLEMKNRNGRPWWPWEPQFLNVTDKPLDSLTKAAALIVAEIDRRLRAGERPTIYCARCGEKATADPCELCEKSACSICGCQGANATGLCPICAKDHFDDSHHG